LARTSARFSPPTYSTPRRRLLNLARDLQQGIEPFPASHGDIYRVRAMDVNTPVDNFDAMIASQAEWFARRGVARVARCRAVPSVSQQTWLDIPAMGNATAGGRSTTFQLAEP